MGALNSLYFPPPVAMQAGLAITSASPFTSHDAGPSATVSGTPVGLGKLKPGLLAQELVEMV
jgi:hypothetical protein